MIGSFQLAVNEVITKKMPNDDIHPALLYHLIRLRAQN